MANEEHLAKLREGVEAWNDWRDSNLEIRPGLSEADIGKANLVPANLNETYISLANLRGATSE